MTAQLQHEVGRREQEGQARDQRRAFLEQRAHDRPPRRRSNSNSPRRRPIASAISLNAALAQSLRRIWSAGTIACSSAEIAKPSTRLHPVCQNIPDRHQQRISNLADDLIHLKLPDLPERL